jgi:hypothetical protein
MASAALAAFAYGAFFNRSERMFGVCAAMLAVGLRVLTGVAEKALERHPNRAGAFLSLEISLWSDVAVMAYLANLASPSGFWGAPLFLRILFCLAAFALILLKPMKMASKEDFPIERLIAWILENELAPEEKAAVFWFKDSFRWLVTWLCFSCLYIPGADWGKGWGRIVFMLGFFWTYVTLCKAASNLANNYKLDAFMHVGLFAYFMFVPANVAALCWISGWPLFPVWAYVVFGANLVFWIILYVIAKTRKA